MAEFPPVAGDGRFFERAGPFPLQAVMRAVLGPDAQSDSPLMLHGVAPLQTAGPGQVSFLDNRRYASLLEATGAGAVIVHPALAERVPAGCVAIPTREPYLGWARAAALFHPPPPLRPGIHPTAILHPSARVDPTTEIGPFAVIEDAVEIGPRCRIGAFVSIGHGVGIGADCRIGAHASVSHAILGERIYLYPGARIGQEGFGFASGPAGHVTVPQLGRVIIGDDVEVGANSCVDRGSAQDTLVGAGTRIDNLVQIGHNVQIGRCCVIVAQTGIAGSVVLEDFVVLGGQAGIAGHLRLGARSRVSAQAGVMTDVPPGTDYAGSPAVPSRLAFRQVAALRRLVEGPSKVD